MDPPTAMPSQSETRILSWENVAGAVSFHIAASSSVKEEPDPTMR
ncbi:hypothetical protein [Parafannyhessea umbonata]|nr:hypothetical protein [Parafannyhessea umbonata]